MHEGAFLLGYLAAGMTKTGSVGTYGGVNIPPVTVFSDGFYLGVMAYNEAHGTDVTVLGWDPEIEGGLFTGDFENTDNGRTMGETLLDAGADIIMPVAGPVGAGTLAVLEERGTGLLLGVDTDWSVFYPVQAEYILASALKRMDLFIVDTVDMMLDGTFEGGQYFASLENGRVGIAYGSAWEDKIPNNLKAEIDDIASKIISGEINAAYPRGE
jgi:basic membrane protein A